MKHDCYVVTVQDYGERYLYRCATQEEAEYLMRVECLPCAMWYCGHCGLPQLICRKGMAA